ncbi:MAG: DsbA family protein [Sandaracinaceae bacterium]
MTRRWVLLGLTAAWIGCAGAQRGPDWPDVPDGACRPADDPDARPWLGRGYDIPVPRIAPRMGTERPRVVVQVFSDFECPFCARAAPIAAQLVEEYGACVQVVWRNRPMPYHEHAALAARAAHEVHRQQGDEGFWRFHDRLFEAETLDRPAIESAAEAHGGLDMEAFSQALDTDTHQALVDRDLATMQRVNPEFGTPSFFVNGHLIHGARTLRVFRFEVETALAELEAATP